MPKKKKKKPSKSVTPLTPEEIEETEKTESEMGIQQKLDKCTVHKGKIQGISYVCPKCQAKYCMKCAQTLHAQKEACWLCGLAIDLGTEEEPAVESEKFILPGNNEEKIISLIKKDLPLENISELNDLNITALSEEFIEKMMKINMEPQDRLAFIKEMLSLTPAERRRILDRMIESDSEEFKG